MDQKIIAFEKLLTEAVEKFLADGGRLRAKSFGSVKLKSACPLRVLLFDLSAKLGIISLEWTELLGAETNLLFSKKELWNFVFGYDQVPSRFQDHEFYELGLRFREKYPPLPEE